MNQWDGQPRVKVRNLTRSFGSEDFTLGPISLELAPGVTCVLGPNGAGKSTLFRILAGIDAADSGGVEGEVGGRRRIGYLPQTFTAPARATCGDYLSYIAYLQGVARRDRDEYVGRALDAVGLIDRRSHRIRELSGGMTRRLGIAQAVVHRPSLVLLDEPTAGLDLEQRNRTARAVRDVASKAVVVVSTHILDDVTRMADHVVVLESGAVAFSGSRDQLLALPSIPEDGDMTDLIMLRSLENILRAPSRKSS